MKNLIGFYVLLILSYFGAAGTAVWTIVEFVLYLVKDKPFNWDSLYWFIGCIIAMIILIVVTVVAGGNSVRKHSGGLF